MATYSGAKRPRRLTALEDVAAIAKAVAFDPIPGRVYRLTLIDRVVIGHVRPCNYVVGVGYSGPFTRVSIVTRRTGRFQGYVSVGEIIDFELL
jgi:hypothetical protein